MHNRCSPTAEVFVGEVKLGDLGMLLQNCVNRASQVADPLPVDDAHPQDAAALALGQIIRHEVLDLARLERVQVQHTVDRQFSRLVVHTPS